MTERATRARPPGTPGPAPKYSPEDEQRIAGGIIAIVATGGYVTDECGNAGVSVGWLWNVMERQPAIREQYARARELGAEASLAKARKLVDDATPETVQVARLQWDAARWDASKRLARTYGDKVEVSGDKDAPLTVKIVRE